jgi:outer membrane receptor for ferrienterochelin and colicin
VNILPESEMMIKIFKNYFNYNKSFLTENLSSRQTNSHRKANPEKWFVVITTLLTFVLFVQSFGAKAATGSIEGVVFDKKTGETLVGAQIILEGTTIGTITDFDGYFIIEGMQTGTYNIKISYISYNPVVFESVIVEANKKVQLKANMEEVSVNLGDITIVAERRKGSDVSVISAIKSNAVVSSGISNQQIMRSQDRDASEVVKRVPGVTIVGDRFIVVRGLNQRYNNVWLNNSSAPSSESDSRAFSFDIVPSSMIENMMIFKAPAPELPGDFSGGFVKLTTKDIPEKNSYTFNIGFGYIPGTTFNDFYKYQGGKLDWLGYDDGTRKLPGYFPADLKTVGTNDQVQLGQMLNKNWTAKASTALPEMRLSFSMSHRFKLKKITIGEVTAINYSNVYEFEQVENNNYGVYQFANDMSGYDFAFNDSVYRNTAKIGAMSNWTAFLGKGNKIEFRNLYNNIGTTKTTFRHGTEYYSNSDIHSYEYGFMSRSNYLGQLSGTHSFNQGSTKIDWLAGYSVSKRQEPDLKRLKLTRNDQPDDVNYNKYRMQFPTAPLTSYAGRVYMDLDENIINGNANLEHTFKNGNFKPVLKAGLFTEKKDREFAARKLGYVYSDPSKTDRSIEYLPFDQMFADENINTTTGIKLAEETGKSDAYTASNTLLAGYVGIQFPISKKFSIYTGLRAEKNKQTLSSFDRYQKPITVVNDTLNLLPSLNAIYSFNDKNLVRTAYGKSLNRPEFREIAPFPFYDFEHNAVFSGNPELKDATIHNAEIRFEHYPSDHETFSFGAFYKKFYNPIEIKYLQTGSGLEYSYQNASEADNYGVEAEIRKSLAENGWLKNFSIVMNGALIKSELKFENKQTELTRPMAGQSPYIFNAGVFYQDEEKSRLMVNVLYNIIGKRISIVGIPQQNEWENIPDIYEMPRHLVDMVISKKIGKYMELKFGVKDLLNQYVVFQQNINTTVDMSYYTGEASDIQQFERTQIIRRFKPGSNYSLELGIRF